ncbi:MAG: hypothetical protein N2559_02175 [Anaerolineae bacterium]|nr:hypothetical protein [Anaerolineae bacterium]
MYIQRIIATGQELLTAFESNNPQTIQASAQKFSQAVSAAWDAYTQGQIPTTFKGAAVPRTMYQFATVELPAMILDPQQWTAASKQLRLFLNMLTVVVEKNVI